MLFWLAAAGEKLVQHFTVACVPYVIVPPRCIEKQRVALQAVLQYQVTAYVWDP